MSMEYNAAMAILPTAVIGVIAQVPDAMQLDALAKWPVTIALVALSALSMWLMYRQADRSRQSLDSMSARIGDLCQRLSERPCIRDPKND